MAVDDQIRPRRQGPLAASTDCRVEADPLAHEGQELQTLMARARPLGRARDHGGRVSLFLGQTHRVIARLCALDMTGQHVVTDLSRQDGMVPVTVRMI